MSGYTTAVVMVGGALLSAYGQKKAGDAQDAQLQAQAQSDEYRAQQMEVQAGQERASSQRRMIEELRKKDEALGNARAASAASGGGSLDPSVVDIMGDLESEGRYNADVALYEGEERARDLTTGGTLARYEATQNRAAGSMARSNGNFAAVSGAVSGLAGAADSNAGRKILNKGDTLMSKYS